MTVEISAIFQIGTLAGRPAAGNAGAHYFATDTGYMYRDSGAAWATEYPAGIHVQSTTLSSAQIKALRATPVLVVDAPASGFVARVIHGAMAYAYGTATYVNGGDTYLSYGSGGPYGAGIVWLGSQTFAQTESVVADSLIDSPGLASTKATANGVALYAFNIGGAEWITGDGTAVLTITYRLIPV